MFEQFGDAPLAWSVSQRLVRTFRCGVEAKRQSSQQPAPSFLAKADRDASMFFPLLFLQGSVVVNLHEVSGARTCNVKVLDPGRRRGSSSCHIGNFWPNAARLMSASPRMSK